MIKQKIYKIWKKFDGKAKNVSEKIKIYYYYYYCGTGV
jgi:hypothetical protein